MTRRNEKNVANFSTHPTASGFAEKEKLFSELISHSL